MARVEKTRYLIIGNSAGGVGAAEAIREVDKIGAITMVSDESYPVYSRPLISEYLAELCPLERMLFRPVDFYESNGIQALLGKEAKRLDTANHTIQLNNGKTIIWEKLLLATGGLPIVPEIDGFNNEGVFTFTKLNDAKAMARFLDGRYRAVVLGGGLIGVSVTEALVRLGVKVTVVEMKEQILSTILDEKASELVTEALEKHGVTVITGHTITRINGHTVGENLVGGVTLDDGRRLPCALVIIAIGVRPRTELASNAGIEIRRGIVVDCFMRTSACDVYACGDAVEAYDFIRDENRLTPIWPNAYLQGRVAGLNMAGIPTEYKGGTSMNSLKYFGLSITSAGMVSPPDETYEVLTMRNSHNYRKVVVKDGVVAGMVFSGDIEKSGIILSLMKDKVNVEDFKDTLVADDFGLISLPEEIWRPMLENPPTTIASSIASAEQPEKVVVRDLRFIFGRQ